MAFFFNLKSTNKNKTLSEHTARLIIHRIPSLNLNPFPTTPKCFVQQGALSRVLHLLITSALPKSRPLRCFQNLGREASPAAQMLVCFGHRDGLGLSSYKLFLKKRQSEKLELESFKAQIVLWDSMFLKVFH